MVERKNRESILDPFKEFINIQVAKDLSAKRIFQVMKRDLGYEGSYNTVKRYVSQIKKSPPKAYMVLTSFPGEEAQVDFGYIGTINLKNGKRKKAWVFIMELSYSRYMYVQTDKNHYPDKKNITLEEIQSRQREEMATIGEHALIFYEMFMKNVKNKYDYRTISGILSLRKEYDNKTINDACHRAYAYGALKYKTVKNICEKGIDLLPVTTNETYVNTEETSLSRPLNEYMKLLQ